MIIWDDSDPVVTVRHTVLVLAIFIALLKVLL